MSHQNPIQEVHLSQNQFSQKIIVENQQKQYFEQIANFQQQCTFPTIVLHQVQSEKSIHIAQQEVKQQLIITENEKKNDNSSQNQIKKQRQFKEKINEQKLETTQEDNFELIVHQIQSKSSLNEDNFQYAKDSQIQQTIQQNNQQIIQNHQERQLKKLKKQEQEQKKDEENKAERQQNDEQKMKNDNDTDDLSEDIYVKILEQKWAKREQQQNRNKTQRKDNDQKKSIKNNKVLKQNQKFRQNLQVIVKIDKKQKEKKDKSKIYNGFKIKKLADERSLLISRDKKSTLPQDNQKQQISPKNINQNLSYEEFKREKSYNNRKNIQRPLSNLDNLNSPKQRIEQKSRPTSNQIFYEISIGKPVEMMSKILEDRFYNQLKTSRDKSNQNRISKQFISQPIRKIIKRSPYGFLQIQVRDQMNSSKITNLRILKPKQMKKLKKCSMLSQQNKQNFRKHALQNNFFSSNLDNSNEVNLNYQKKSQAKSSLPFLNSCK